MESDKLQLEFTKFINSLEEPKRGLSNYYTELMKKRKTTVRRRKFIFVSSFCLISSVATVVITSIPSLNVTKFSVPSETSYFYESGIQYEDKNFESGGFLDFVSPQNVEVFKSGFKEKEKKDKPCIVYLQYKDPSFNAHNQIFVEMNNNEFEFLSFYKGLKDNRKVGKMSFGYETNYYFNLSYMYFVNNSFRYNVVSDLIKTKDLFNYMDFIHNKIDIL